MVSPGCRRGLSVLARAVSRRALGSRTTPDLLEKSGLSFPSVWPSRTGSASGLRFSKLNSRPVDTSVYTSSGTSRHPAQDSRPRFATPFLSCGALSSPTARRFIPTIALAHAGGAEVCCKGPAILDRFHHCSYGAEVRRKFSPGVLCTARPLVARCLCDRVASDGFAVERAA